MKDKVSSSATAEKKKKTRLPVICPELDDATPLRLWASQENELVLFSPGKLHNKKNVKKTKQTTNKKSLRWKFMFENLFSLLDMCPQIPMFALHPYVLTPVSAVCAKNTIECLEKCFSGLRKHELFIICARSYYLLGIPEYAYTSVCIRCRRTDERRRRRKEELLSVNSWFGTWSLRCFVGHVA